MSDPETMYFPSCENVPQVTAPLAVCPLKSSSIGYSILAEGRLLLHFLPYSMDCSGPFELRIVLTSVSGVTFSLVGRGVTIPQIQCRLIQSRQPPFRLGRTYNAPYSVVLKSLPYDTVSSCNDSQINCKQTLSFVRHSSMKLICVFISG